MIEFHRCKRRRGLVDCQKTSSRLPSGAAGRLHPVWLARGRCGILPDTSNIGHNATLLSGVRIVDAGDVDVRLDAAVTRERTTSRARSIIDLGRLLASIVGGYSVSFPLLAAFEKLDPLTVVLLDVHPDYRD
jgi:hypothetical protein